MPKNEEVQKKPKKIKCYRCKTKYLKEDEMIINCKTHPGRSYNSGFLFKTWDCCDSIEETSCWYSNGCLRTSHFVSFEEEKESLKNVLHITTTEEFDQSRLNSFSNFKTLIIISKEELENMESIEIINTKTHKKLFDTKETKEKIRKIIEEYEKNVRDKKKEILGEEEQSFTKRDLYSCKKITDFFNFEKKFDVSTVSKFCIFTRFENYEIEH